MAPHCCLLYQAWLSFSIGHQNNKTEPTVQTQWPEIKICHVSYCAGRQYLFLGNMSMGGWGLAWERHTNTEQGYSPLPRRFLPTPSHQVTVRVHCFIFQGGTVISLIHLNSCKNTLSMVITLHWRYSHVMHEAFCILNLPPYSVHALFSCSVSTSRKLRKVADVDIN